MKLHYVFVSLMTFAALLVAGSALAAPLAWPSEPPDKAFISGPGLVGEVEIIDKATLEALKLGAIEDFDKGAIPAPNVGEGFTITRYFYGGSVRFGILHYYPNSVGGRGYIYFEDGPDFEGDHTAYNDTWLYATPAGDVAMQALLKDLSASPRDWKAAYTVILVGLIVGMIFLRRRSMDLKHKVE